jgi:hypothetical protein
LVAALLMASLAGSVSAQSAFDELDGKDPDVSGCSADSQVVDKTVMTKLNGVRVGTVRLMYSDSCLTFWSRVVSDNGNAFEATIFARDAVNTYSFSKSFSASGISHAGNSPMVSASGRLGQAKGRIELAKVAIEALTRECGPPDTLNACLPR